MSQDQSPPPSIPTNEEELALAIAKMTWDLKGLNTIVIDLRGRVSYTDFLVISSATSERQVTAIARHVHDELARIGKLAIAVEGLESGRWALLDYGDVILHVFNQSMRQEFNLEGMWTQAPRLDLPNKPASLYGHFEMSQFDA
jgi:ribosome-associated protein